MKLAKLFEAAAVLVAGIALGSATQANYQRQLSQTQQAPGTPAIVYVVVTATPEGEAAQPKTTSTSEPTATRLVITVGPMTTSTPTSIPEPTSTQAVQVATLAPATIAPQPTEPGNTRVSPPVAAEVANDTVNVRAAPGRDAERAAQLTRGASVTIFERRIVDGETWAHVTFSQGGRTANGWVLESLLTEPGAAAASPRPTFTRIPALGLGAEPGFVCPRNCAEARERGVSAQQAAACGLDRDGDGVACYDD